MNRSALLLALLGSVAGLEWAAAHDLYAAYVQHRVAVTVGARHIDVTLQLTFFEDGSEHEREHMDTDADGRVSPREVEGYLNELEPRLSQAVTLRLDSGPVRLIPLYGPEVDLLGNDRVGRGHHRLTVRFFAPTPVQLAAGSELILEDRLWPEASALVTIQVETKDACVLQAIPPEDPVQPAARRGESRAFRLRVLAAPVLPPEPSVTAARPEP